MVYQRSGGTTFYVEVPTRTGGRVKLATGTKHRGTAKAIERMLIDLGPKGRRAWDLLEAVAGGVLTLGKLYDAFAVDDLDGLRARMVDVDLSPHVDTWLARIGEDIAADTRQHYEHLVRSFIPEGKKFERSAFTVDALHAWLAAYPASRSTRRKAHAAMSGFAKYLVRAQLIPVNPMRSIDAPPANGPRLRWLDVPDMKRLADAQPEPYRTLSALLGGSGVEVSVAVGLLRRDVDLARKEVRAAGTKTHARDRIVRVAEWAWPYIERAGAGLTPNARLFPTLDRWMPGDEHRAACKVLGIDDYTMRDMRHSYAVRAARAGTPAELIARQLGHANAVLVLKIYGRFMPSQADRDKWEQIATAQDAETARAAKKVAQMGAQAGALPRNNESQPPLSDWLPSSRGGTRTRDPGIMSAVL